ncbi:MAG: hypothetical protein ACJA1B_000349 [Polaribacter sp.]|jgi:hypothetical protein
MKKITLLVALMISSIGFSQEVLQDFENGGLGEPFGDAAASIVADPETGGSRGDVAMLSSNSNGTVWQGINISLLKNVDLTSDLTMTMDVYSTVAITIAPKVVNGSGAPDSTTSVSHTGSGWENLTMTFNQGLDGTVPANGSYSGFVIYYNWNAGTSGFGAQDSRVFYVDNISGIGAEAVVSAAPTDAPPTPPSYDAVNVISLFSDAYTDVSNVTWGTDWDSANITDEEAAGNNVKKVDIGAFLGVDFSSTPLNLNDFTHFHIDLWTESETQDKSFNHKLSNHAAGAGETSAIEFATTNASSPVLPNPNPGGWISYDIPLSSFTVAGVSLDREAIAQYILSSNLGIVYLDNIYFYKEGTASVANNELLGFSMYPNPTKNLLNISAKETIQKADIFNVLGKKVMSVNVNDTQASVDVSNLSSGIYLIKYNVNDAVGTAKFIKE